jgi:hypothetical protein
MKHKVLNIVVVCLYSCLSYLVGKSHLSAPCCTTCGLSGCGLFCIFLHYPINCTIFGGKNIEYNICVLIFSTNFV